MEFRFSDEDEAFRADVQAFLAAELPAWWQSSVDGRDDDERWHFTRSFQKRLAERGWLTLAWPRKHGGAGAGHIRQALFTETMAYERAPIYSQGADRVGPTIMLSGSAEQRAFFLPKIRNAEIVWCQGFSEPGSGSDLALLQTRAVRDGDDYVINGQKIWTSHAHHADWIFLLARTDPDAPKHRGISFFLIDMATPGITVRPLADMSGRRYFNEVFCEDVRVPAANVVGEENQGWYVATKTLDFERSGIGRVMNGIRTLAELTEVAKRPGPDGRRLLDDDQVRYRLADLHVEFAVGRLLAYRVAWMQSVGLAPNYEASISKLYGSELQQRLANMLNVVGLAAQLRDDGMWAPLAARLPQEYLLSVPLTIAAGTSEIQRNIIATRGLGLPRN